MKPFIPVLIVILLVFGGLAAKNLFAENNITVVPNNINQNSNSQNLIQQNTNNQPTNTNTTNKTYSLADISTHNNANSCWMAISGNVYDVTSYVSQHPGGNKILYGCGKDATVMFNQVGVHQGQNSQDRLSSLQIGTLQ